MTPRRPLYPADIFGRAMLAAGAIMILDTLLQLAGC